ncbi:hypothetical protein ACJIZ3_013735 [Penstemon smallii]|uniref:CREG-like beta-barrel domain-containing protein n=1 Tax=Penstemon smallii TaxID=265156 RepID=A0ABD3RJG7_9LAMI
MSFTDAGTGVPYFYLTTTLDPTGNFAVKDERASCAITEKQLGTCGIQDPQSPGCSKFTIIGKLIMVQTNTTEGAFGESALFSSHPQFLGWPKRTHAFDVFKLVPVRLFLVNNFKPPRRLSVKKYLGYKFL